MAYAAPAYGYPQGGSIKSPIYAPSGGKVPAYVQQVPALQPPASSGSGYGVPPATPSPILPYDQMGSLDAATAGMIQGFMNTAKNGTVSLPDLTQYLTAQYTPFKFTAPNYKSQDYKAFNFTNAPMTQAADIQSVADLPQNVKDAIWEQTVGGLNRNSNTQRQQAIDMLRQQGEGNGNLMIAAMRGINNSQNEAIAQAAIAQMIDDANRNYQEAQNVRSLRLGREETLANQDFQRQQAQAGQNQAAYQSGRDEARYQAGLQDTLQTRQAAEAEKAYQSLYGKQQDIVNTKMNQAQFQSAETANQASREQAAIQQGLNYLNQAGNYKINTAQLADKNGGNVNYDVLGSTYNAGSGGGYTGGYYLPYTYKPLGG